VRDVGYYRILQLALPSKLIHDACTMDDVKSIEVWHDGRWHAKMVYTDPSDGVVKEVEHDSDRMALAIAGAWPDAFDDEDDVGL
jgi:hypothetical protein